MTLEDFFTLTEMNNGLTAPSRVRELMAVMEKERECIVKNAADSTRQWSAVASAIAATENKDCLDLFLQLDGLHFISKWLKDAQKFCNDTIDSFVEESITHLLRALEKLDVDYDNLVASGIWTIVQNLLVHNSSKVQDEARALFESWKAKKDSNASILDVDKAGAFTADEAGKIADVDRGIGHSESSVGDASISRETSVNSKGHELTKDVQVLPASSNAVPPEEVESANNLDKILKTPSGDERSLHHVSSPSLPKPTTEHPIRLSVSTTSEPCSPAVPRQDTLDNHTEFHDSESTNYNKQSLKNESLSEKIGSIEESSKTSKGRSFNPSPDAVEEMKAVTDVSSQRYPTAGTEKSCDEGLSCINFRTIESDGKGVKDEGSHANQSTTSQVSDFSHHMLSRSCSNEKSWGNPKDLGTFLSGIEDDGKANTLGLHASDNDLANNYTLSKKLTDRKPDRSGRKSDVEIDYGIVDPLEVARQVAIEVEREVCSSSEKLPEGNTGKPDSPDGLSRKQSRSSKSSPKEVANDANLSEEFSPMQEESASSSGNLDAEQMNGERDMVTSQVTEAAQEEANEEKGLCDFDLNQDVCLEDSDHPGNQLSTPVSIVSASRAAAAPGMPSAPLQFEGNLGWKGSAVTSAFRPASPRRMPECDKDPSTGGSSSSSKQRQGCLDIDLNVAESIDPRVGDLPPDKHGQFYSRVTSGESSAETNSRRSEHFALDLNHTSEEGGSTSMSDWRIEQFFPQGHNHHSQPHSSLSSKQPIRNIDLNDQPFYLNDSSVNSYLSPVSQNFSISGGIKSDECAISIMGRRVEVKQKDNASQTSPVPNGRTTELAFDVNLSGASNFLGIGSGLPYTHSSVYGYNNIAPGLSMPFSSTIYGSGAPIPYMVDSRGQPVIPQIVGSASALPTAFSQPPFVINMNSSIPSNGAGSSRSSFDLNSGMLAETGSKDPAGLGLFLNSAQVRAVDSQPSISSVISGKRKEPENGWEHYPLNHYTQPWKQS